VNTIRIVHGSDGVLYVAGDLHRGNVAEFGTELLASARAARPPLVIDLFELELDDGAAVLAAVDALRALGSVTVRQAPHWLAHSLYRINALGDDAIVLEAPREEEPYG
jgi:anti-anti-sigma regulatory factor